MIPTYPARPMNGGSFEKRVPLPGVCGYEPKYNGWRTLVHISTGTMFNRQGERLSIHGEFDAALKQLAGVLDAEAFKWADCEGLERRHGLGKGTLIVLDVVPEPAYAKASYEERRRWLNIPSLPTLYPTSQPEPNTIYQSAQIAPEHAAEYWHELRRINVRWGCEFYEGLVAKRVEAPYPIQLRSPNETTTAWIKHRWKW